MALRDAENTLTYQSLDCLSNQLAHYIVQHWSPQSGVIGLSMERRADLIVCILAILKTGCAYLPLDPDYPQERLVFMVADACPDLIITNQSQQTLFSDQQPLMVFEDVKAQISQCSDQALTMPSPDQMAYIIYTSGSTGKPKGVMVNHRHVLRLFDASNDWYQFNQDDVWTCFHSYAFDFSVWEIWGALLHGGQLVMVPYWVSRSPTEFIELVQTAKVTVLNQTPSAFYALMQAYLASGQVPLSLRYVIFGGEALDISALKPWVAVYGDQQPQLVNMYGITETTVHVTYRPLSMADINEAKGSLIGQVIPDLNCYLVDQYGNPVPLGVPGELWVAGDGVTVGYLNHPELTAERFIESPFHPSERIYKTGDLARLTVAGELEYLGRIDNQVKIRGFRIELGEIEAVLKQHEMVADCVVIMSGQGETAHIVAYIVPCEPQQVYPDLLSQHLGVALPDYMIPAFFIALDEIPLNTNGKLDRKALPLPESAPRQTYRAPTTDTEIILAGLWGALLATESVGADDNFFASGGHSLLAAQLVSRIQSAFDVDFPIREIFENAILAAMALKIDQRSHAVNEMARSVAIQKAPDKVTFPLSFAQERLWFLHQLDPSSSGYNIPIALRFKGELNIDALSQTLDLIRDRHQILKSAFKNEGDAVIQVVDTNTPWSMMISHLDDATEALSMTIKRLIEHPFDLSTGPLFCADLLVLNEHDHVLVINLHHSVADGWSLNILLQEMTLIYDAIIHRKEPEMAPLAVQYSDFAYWQRHRLELSAIEEQTRYWKNQLAGIEMLELPTDYPRPAVMSEHGKNFTFVLDQKVTQRLHHLAQQNGVTLFMVMMAGFKIFLSRYSGQNDITIGSPIAGRQRREIEGLIGCFVNTLVLRSDLSANPIFEDYLKVIKQMTITAFENQDVPFEQVVNAVSPNRELSHTPLFQVMFSVHSNPPFHAEMSDLNFSVVNIEGETAKFDLSLDFVEIKDQLQGVFEYNTDLFSQRTIEQMAASLTVLFNAIVDQPQNPVHQLPLVSKQQQHQICYDWNLTQNTATTPYDTIHQWLENSIVIRSPDSHAVIYGEEVLSYHALNTQANQMAHYLQQQGVGPDVLVALCVDRCVDMIVAMLAILKAGGAFVPLDPAYPQQRLDWIVKDIQAPVMICHQQYQDRFGQFEGEYICLDALPKGILNQSEESPVVSVIKDHLAYVIYTSGSTGKPKGVMISHANLSNFIESAIEVYQLNPLDHMLQFASISFDVSIEEIFPTLLVGGTLVLRSDDMLDSARMFFRGVDAWDVTVVSLPTAFWHELTNQIADFKDDIPACLRQIIIGGERVLPDKLKTWQQQVGSRVRLINGYGPTECTVIATTFNLTRFTEINGEIPIGKPIFNTQVYVLDPFGQPLPPGVPGELHIAGAGVARGYLNQPDLTANAFIPNPFNTDGGRLYKTGDRVRYLQDGQLQYLGRVDQQIKFRGYRIELGEIESALSSHPLIEDCVVILKDDKKIQQLVGYVQIDRKGSLTTNDIRQFVEQALPHYMIPSAFVMLAQLPMTNGGKVDRKALPEPDHHLPKSGEAVAPRNPVETVLAEIWNEVLGIDKCWVHDNFFELGGHSLLATQVVSRIRRIFRIELPLKDLFESPTIAELSRQIEVSIEQEQEGIAAPDILSFDQVSEIPLSYAQERLWFLHQLEPQSPLYNIPVALNVEGDLDTKIIQQTVIEIVRRHETLRTTFEIIEGKPVQKVIPIAKIKSSFVSYKDATDEQVDGLIAADAQWPFDLTGGNPLFRITIVQLSHQQRLLLFNMHHIISDGWSLGIFVREFSQLYVAFQQGRPSPLSPLTVQYRDYACWQRNWLDGEVKDKLARYWQQQLQNLPILEIPTDYARPAFRNYAGRTYTLLMPRAMRTAVHDFAKQANATVYMVLLAVFEVMLYRYTGQSDFAIGTPIAGRTQEALEELIGFFINTLVIRARIAPMSNFETLLDSVRTDTLAAYGHQEMPFEQLVEMLQPDRNDGHTPLFQVLFALQNTPIPDVEQGDLSIKPILTETHTAKFDLSLFVEENEDGLTTVWEYSTELFEASTIAQMAMHYQILLRRILVNPQSVVDTIPMIGKPESLMLQEFNQTTTEYPALSHVAEQVSLQVQAKPDAIALRFEDQTLTYQQLNEQANQLAHYLLSNGLQVEDRVAVCLHRSIELIVTLLAIVKSGGVYVPLDASYPESRLNYMLNDALPSHLITDGELLKQLPSFTGQTLLLDQIDAIAQMPIENPDLELSSWNLIYILYTSGSTGQPKGVAVEHRSVLRLVCNTHYVDIQAEDVFLQLAPVSFDASTFEIWGALINGATLVVHPPGMPSLQALGQILQEQKVTILWLTAALFHQMVDHCLGELKGVKQLLAGGDQLSAEHVKRALSGLPDTCLINGYGPTENTTFTCCHRMNAMTQLKHRVPIGKAISNTTVYILNHRGERAPIGVLGELFAGGDGLARGYWNKPELTASQFVERRIDRETVRLYRTGDMARIRDNGVVEFMGRLDEQIKVRGHRVEPGEIESYLESLTDIAQAVVVLREDQLGDQRLVGYLVAADASDLDLKHLEVAVKAHLPAYMVPSHYVVMDALPLTPVGKVDRKQLPKPDLSKQLEDDRGCLPRNSTEQVLSSLWSEILGVEQVCIKENFFELGGHSLLATQLIARVNENFHINLPLKTLFEAPTPEKLALHIHLNSHVDQAVPEIKAYSSETPIPLSFAQERLWFLDQLTPFNAVYNIPYAMKIRGSFDIDALSHTFETIIERHHALRTTINSKDGQVWQQVNVFSAAMIEIVDGSDLTPEQALDQLHQWADTGFDLAAGPLFIVRVIKLSASEHLLFINMHHIISDGWSIAVLMKEMNVLYEAISQQQQPPSLPKLSIQFGDYAIWQREWLQGDVLSRQLAFWKDQLTDCPVLLNLPTDRPRPEVQQFHGDMVNFKIEADLSHSLLTLCHQNGATLFMGLLSIWQLLLSRYCGQNDICVGTPVAGRTIPQTEDLIGFFVNALIIRGDLSTNPSFVELLAQVRKTCLDAFSFQDVPADQVIESLSIERNLSHAPIAQVAFALQNIPWQTNQLHELEVEWIELTQKTAKYDITLSMMESPEGLSATFEYNTDLFDQTTIQTMAEHFRYLLMQILNAPTACFNSLQMASQDQLFTQLKLSAEDYESIAPLTTTQRDIYLDVLRNGSSHTLGNAVLMPTQFDPEQWQQAVTHVFQLLPVARTQIIACQQKGLDFAYQVVSRQINLCERVDISHQEWPDEALQAWVEQQIHQPFQLNQHALVRHLIVKITTERYIVVTAIHHLIGDGVSSYLFEMLLNKAYQALSKDQLIHDEQPAFSATVASQLGRFDTTEVASFWRQQLAEAAPFDVILPNVAETQKQQAELPIAAQHWKEIRQFCRSQAITPAIYFKTLFGLLLNGYYQPDHDFYFYEIIDGRVKSERNTAGCFYQQLPMVFKSDFFNQDQSIVDLIRYTKSFVKAGNEFKAISVMLQQQISPPGRVHFYFNYYHFQATAEFEGQPLQVWQYDPVPNDHHVYFIVNAGHSSPVLKLHYHDQYFNESALLERIMWLSQQICNGIQNVGDLQWVTAQEQDKLLKQYNATEVDYKPVDCLHYLFEQQVQQRPDAIALTYAGQSLTYQELNQYANRLAYQLRSQAIKPGCIVGVCMVRSFEMVVALLGILKSGGAYLPLDPDYPMDRLNFMVNDADVQVILVQNETEAIWKSSPLLRLPLYCKGENLITGYDHNPEIGIDPQATAYVIYTSGSTGTPKGVMVPHQGIVNRLLWMQDAYQLTTTDKVAQKTPYSFDVSVWEFFWPLMAGATLVVTKPDGHKDAEYLAQFIQDEGITTLHFVPSMLSAFLDCRQASQCQSLKQVIVSGEALTKELQTRFFEVLNADLHNLYGPTEASVDVTYWPCQRDASGQAVPIGYPIANTQIYLLNSALQLVPPGIPGELHIGGVGLAKGYLNRPELTAEKFISSPFSDDDNVKLYKTGDLARYNQEGVIEYLGRIDFQVKLRGLRIELGEIETALRHLAQVQDAVVMVDNDHLVAYVVMDADSILENTDIKVQLAMRLPSFMIPNVYIQIASIPLSANGKINRKALPLPDYGQQQATPYVAPRDDVEKQLIAIWQQVLGIEHVGIHHQFFDLGGHSLSAVKLVTMIEHQLDKTIPLASLFKYTTVALLAEYLKAEQSQTPAYLIPLQTSGEQAPLFIVHGVGGHAMPFAKLASMLNEDCPVYGFESPGLQHKNALQSTLPEIAQQYILALKTVQPEGPYYLAGHSFGGLVAYEMAQQLSRNDETVKHLLLLETASPEYLNSHSMESHWQDVAAQLFENQTGKAARTQDFEDAEEFFNNLKHKLPDHMKRVVEVYQHHIEAMFSYQVLDYHAKVQLVVACQTAGHTKGWSNVIKGEFIEIEVTGDHDSILDEPGVEAIVDLIKVTRNN